MGALAVTAWWGQGHLYFPGVVLVCRAGHSRSGWVFHWLPGISDPFNLNNVRGGSRSSCRT
eukprot:15431407-Alexandrium_andersonii.AAC.1